MDKQMEDQNFKLEELRLLDLNRCQTVASMEFCLFDARRLGEVAATIADWLIRNMPTYIVYGGRLDTPLANYLNGKYNQLFLMV